MKYNRVMRKKYYMWFSLSIIIAMFLLSIYFYPMMPEKMATHFDAQGVANGFMERFWGMFFLPILSLVLYVIFLIIPHIDPLGENIKKFEYYYYAFIAIFMLFMFYIEFAIILWNIGIRLNILRFISVPIGLLYVYLGILFLKAKRNWFIGVRTPWTIMNDEVWDKTNRIVGKFFVVDGILVMISFIFSRFIELFTIWLVLVVFLFSIVYSYILWAKVRGREPSQ